MGLLLASFPLFVSGSLTSGERKVYGALWLIGLLAFALRVKGPVAIATKPLVARMAELDVRLRLLTVFDLGSYVPWRAPRVCAHQSAPSKVDLRERSLGPVDSARSRDRFPACFRASTCSRPTLSPYGVPI